MSTIKKLDKVYNRAMLRLDRWAYSRGSRKRIRKYGGANSLSREQLRQVEEFFAPYCKVSGETHAFFAKSYGEFHPEFLPNDIYHNYIDRYYNDAKKAEVLENKCYFPRIFPGVKQAGTVCYRMNGFWFNVDNEIIGYEKAKDLVQAEQAVVLKQAIGSSGGKAVFFLDNDGNIEAEFVRLATKIKRDILIQRPIRQHPELNRMNGSSVNSLRIMSFLSEDGVKIYSAVLRMGVNGSRVDNLSSGGVNCGIQDDGCLRKRGHTEEGEVIDRHPTSGVAFDGFRIPNFEKVLQTIRQIHVLVPHFRIVCWDFTVDDCGDPVLIEANLNRGGIFSAQYNNGPLFGEDTKMILDEVFLGKKIKK